jgi:hypothetical protein
MLIKLTPRVIYIKITRQVATYRKQAARFYILWSLNYRRLKGSLGIIEPFIQMEIQVIR